MSDSISDNNIVKPKVINPQITQKKELKQENANEIYTVKNIDAKQVFDYANYQGNIYKIGIKHKNPNLENFPSNYKNDNDGNPPSPGACGVLLHHDEPQKKNITPHDCKPHDLTDDIRPRHGYLIGY